MSPFFRISLLVSAGLHLACFGIFEPTFGSSLQKLSFAKVTFLGPILQNRDLYSSIFNTPFSLNQNIGKQVFLKPLSGKSERFTLPTQPIKPPAVMSEEKQRMPFVFGADLDYLNKPKKEPTLVFYPPLPYSFLLYFQDRQVAHIEFMFYVSSGGKISSIKRKVSSGNLDADLLSLRYIAYCLNLAEGRFAANTWQKVNIDLTRKDD